MKSFLRIVSVLAWIAALGSCSSATAPTAPNARAGHTSVSLHGRLVVPAEGTVGVQGRTDASFVDDRGEAYDLGLAPDFQFLNDPDLNGRTLTITGELVDPEYVPVGGPYRVLNVVEARFDPLSVSKGHAPLPGHGYSEIESLAKGTTSASPSNRWRPVASRMAPSISPDPESR